MSQLADVCRALDEAVRPLPALATVLQQRAGRLRSLAAEVERAARQLPGGPDCRRVVDGLWEAAASAQASGQALATAVTQGRAFVARTIGVGSAAGVGRSGVGDSASAAVRIPAGAPPGFAMVPLSLVDDSDSGVHGLADFRPGYPPEELRWAFGALREVVLPAMASGLGQDYFAELDQQHGYQGVHSYSDTYSGFFDGNNSIVLDWRPGGYEVKNGFHRIWLARQIGLDEVPALVRG